MLPIRIRHVMYIHRIVFFLVVVMLFVSVGGFFEGGGSETESIYVAGWPQSVFYYEIKSFHFHFCQTTSNIDFR